MFIESIEKKREEVHRLSLDSANEGYQLLHDGLELYALVFIDAQPKEDPNLALARMSFVSHNFNTLYFASEAAFSGFYLQALGVLRNVYENWLAFWYLAKFPEDKHLWLEANPQKRPPKAETMRNRIDHPSKEAKANLAEFYGVLSRFTHTDPVIAISRFKNSDNQPAILAGIEFNETSLHSCIYAIALWIGFMLDAASDWIPENSNWHSSHKVLKERILAFMNKHNEM